MPSNPLEAVSAFFLSIYLAGYIFLVGFFFFVVIKGLRKKGHGKT